jgi:hypothetical protein
MTERNSRDSSGVLSECVYKAEIDVELGVMR